jgi:inorganic pyrophosphatase
MLHFFNVYKALEDKEAVAKEVNGYEAAIGVISDALDRYVESFWR